MTFAEKLKAMRKQASLSQEQLAEKLNVSRQAITKWETEAGTPDIGNLIAIAALFDLSLDELLSNETAARRKTDFLYESTTEYDIDEPKRFDMDFGGAGRLVLSGYSGEKLRVRLASNTLPELERDFKVKIDDVKNRIDVGVTRKNGATETAAKESLTIFVYVPSPYLGKIELAVHADTVEVKALECDSIELELRSSSVTLDGVVGTVEIDCNLDMEILCRTLSGQVEINQLNATSRIHVPQGTPFAAQCKGLGTTISYRKAGQPTEVFCDPNAENVIELNGLKSELVICREGM